MTLDDLIEAYNQLHNVVQGRGLHGSAASTELQFDEASTYDAWRLAKADEWVTDDIAAALTAGRWVERYRALQKRAAAEGLVPGYVLEDTVIESGKKALDTAGDWLAGFAGVAGLAVVGLAGLAAFAYFGKKR